MKQRITGVRSIVFLCWVFIAIKHTAYSQVGPSNAQLELQQTETSTISPLDSASIQKNIELAMSIADRNADSATALLEQAAIQALAIRYDRGVIFAYRSLGYCYKTQGRFDKSLLCYRIALQYAQKTSYSKSRLAGLYNEFAGYWTAIGRDDSNAFYNYKAEWTIRGAQIHNAKEAGSAINIYNSLGTLWIRLNNLEVAIPFLKKALEVAVSYKDYKRIATSYNNLGTVYQEKYYYRHEKPDSAYYYFQAAMQIGKMYNPPAYRTAALNLATMFYYEDQPQKTAAIATDVISQYIGSKNNAEFIKAFYLLGLAQFELRNYDKAETALLFSLEKAEATHSNPEDIQDASDKLSSIYGATGRYKEAFFYQKKSRDLMDTLREKQTLKTVYELENKSRNAEKDKQLAESKLMIAQQQNRIKDRGILIGGTTAGIVILSLALGGTIRHSRNKQRLQKEKIRNMENSSKIEQLQAMVQGEEKERARIARELHDGVMSQFLALKLNIKTLQRDHPELEADGNYQQVMQQVADAAEELRDTSHKLIPEILLHGLPEAIRSFCDKLNKTHKIKLDFQQYDPLPPLNYNFSLSVYRIVQELVQNVIKHSGATEAIIQINCTGGLMSLTIEDNGHGFDKALKSDGAGLRNVRQRVDALKGSMDLQTEAGTGTAVYMEFEVVGLEVGDQLCT